MGEDIEVPFISWLPLRVQFGTDVMAPPGALMQTPNDPSTLQKRKVINVVKFVEEPTQDIEGH